MITEKESQQLLKELSRGFTVQGIVEQMTKDKKKEVHFALESLKHGYSTQRMFEDFCEENYEDGKACDDFREFLQDEKTRFIISHVINSIYDAEVLLTKLLKGQF